MQPTGLPCHGPMAAERALVMSVGGDTLAGVAQLAQGQPSGASGGRPLSLDLLWQVGAVCAAVAASGCACPTWLLCCEGAAAGAQACPAGKLPPGLSPLAVHVPCQCLSSALRGALCMQRSRSLPTGGCTAWRPGLAHLHVSQVLQRGQEISRRTWGILRVAVVELRGNTFLASLGAGPRVSAARGMPRWPGGGPPRRRRSLCPALPRSILARQLPSPRGCWPAPPCSLRAFCRTLTPAARVPAGARVFWRPCYRNRGLGLRLPAQRRLLAGPQGKGARPAGLAACGAAAALDQQQVGAGIATADLLCPSRVNLCCLLLAPPSAVQGAHLHPPAGVAGLQPSLLRVCAAAAPRGPLALQPALTYMPRLRDCTRHLPPFLPARCGRTARCCCVRSSARRRASARPRRNCGRRRRCVGLVLVGWVGVCGWVGLER